MIEEIVQNLRYDKGYLKNNIGISGVHGYSGSNKSD
jgi:hypothetical protein